MNNQVRCKACGLIIEEKRLKKVCPACGVPRNAFEPYTEKVSATRKMYLDLHIHPIAVHFPQASAVFIPVFILGRLLFSTFSFTEGLVSAATILTVLLPLTAIPAALAGLADAKVRFKKLTTPYLYAKMLLAGAFIVMSSIMAGMALTGDLEGMTLVPFFLLNLGCILCQVFMGKIGVQLMFTVLPG